jgi:hypothetical protein
MSPDVFAASLAGVTAVAVAVTPLWSAARERRRSRYSSAARVLVEWYEFPYRIARRTSDSADELSELTGIGHRLQERLTEQRAWLDSDSRRVSEVYGSVADKIREWVAMAAREAWSRPPAKKPKAMNLDLTSYPGNVTKDIAKYTAATRWRFGLRRLIWWKP